MENLKNSKCWYRYSKNKSMTKKSTVLKAETEGLIIAAQDYSLPMKNYWANIITNGSNLICRLCKKKIESIV